MMPNDLPPWYTVQQQTQRWLAAGVFAAMVHDLRALLAAGRQAAASAALFDARTTLPPKTVGITFDDGYLDNFQYALPILLSCGVPATFFVVTGLIAQVRQRSELGNRWC
jgi:peptidoglycan/xylan/chitin deacetylase (PgdA/CDA1 family)